MTSHIRLRLNPFSLLARVTQLSAAAAAVVLLFVFFIFFPCVPLFDSMSSSALASLADDVIPIDTGAARWESQRFLARVPHEYMDASQGTGQDEHVSFELIFLICPHSLIVPLSLSVSLTPALSFSLTHSLFSLSTRRTWARTWDTGINTDKRWRHALVSSGAFMCRASFICMLPSVHFMD